MKELDEIVVRHALNSRQLTGFHAPSAILCLPVDFDQPVGASCTCNIQSCSSVNTRNIFAYAYNYLTKAHKKCSISDLEDGNLTFNTD